MIQAKPDNIRLYIVEEQEICREMYNYISIARKVYSTRGR